MYPHHCHVIGCLDICINVHLNRCTLMQWLVSTVSHVAYCMTGSVLELKRHIFDVSSAISRRMFCLLWLNLCILFAWVRCAKQQHASDISGHVIWCMHASVRACGVGCWYVCGSICQAVYVNCSAIHTVCVYPWDLFTVRLCLLLMVPLTMFVLVT